MRPAALGLVLAVALLAGPVQGHVAVILLVVAPEDGATVGPDTELVVRAQPALNGVEETSFTVALDGRPLDPSTGRPGERGPSIPIRLHETKRIPLRGLEPGAHRVTVTYRSDVHAAPRENTVVFTVAETASWVVPVASVLATALLLGLTTAVFWLRRTRTP